MAEIGDIAQARITGTIDDRVYSLQAEIAGGEYKGKPAQVVYRGDSEEMIGKTIVAVVSLPSIVSGLKKIDISMNLLTQRTDEFIEGMNLENTLLLGKWEAKWSKNEDSPIPNLPQVYHVYPIGIYKEALIYFFGQRIIEPYRLVGRNAPEVMMHYDTGESSRIRSIKSALKRQITKVIGYEKKMSSQRNKKFRFHKIVLIHENVDFKRRILPEVIAFLKENDFGIKYALYLEPQLPSQRIVIPE